MTEKEFNKQNFNSSTKVLYDGKEYLVLGVSFKRDVVEGLNAAGYIAIDINNEPFMLSWLRYDNVEIVKKIS